MANVPLGPHGHPYFPTDLPLQSYSPQDQLSTAECLAYMFLPLAVFLIATSLIYSVYYHTRRGAAPDPGQGEKDKIGRLQPPQQQLAYWERFLFSWFSLCGALHIFFEGAFIFQVLLPDPSSSRSDAIEYTPIGYDTNPVLSSPNTVCALWRHYALSDSRYILPRNHPSFTFIVSIELLTVLVTGPLSLYAAYTTLGSAPRWGTCALSTTDMRACDTVCGDNTNYSCNYAARWIPRVVVSAAHLWGVAMYFVTAAWDNHMWSRPEKRWFWGYFVAMNAPWVIIPAAVMVAVAREMASVGRALQGLGKVDVDFKQAEGSDAPEVRSEDRSECRDE